VENIKSVRSIRFPKSLENRIEKASNDFSEFVRQACIEKLARKIKEDKDNADIDKFMDELIAFHPEQKMVDLQMTSTLIFREIKKQNEILKLLLRRTTSANRVACASLKQLTNSETVQAEINNARDAVATELEEIEL
jgi:hypothetical protein